MGADCVSTSFWGLEVCWVTGLCNIKVCGDELPVCAKENQGANAHERQDNRDNGHKGGTCAADDEVFGRVVFGDWDVEKHEIRSKDVGIGSDNGRELGFEVGAEMCEVFDGWWDSDANKIPALVRAFDAEFRVVFDQISFNN